MLENGHIPPSFDVKDTKIFSAFYHCVLLLFFFLACYYAFHMFDLQVMNLIGDVKGKVAVMVDDMIDTAGDEPDMVHC